ncbi:DUF3916 domain-containing protein [Dickeya solani]|uniref:Group-specific protein n=1 Tax=Dickeya solani D s0432-1 TaxID=1231725 RepID=A0AAV3KF33_9GAMM|nr:DUF3916 domain-containing protein [Dickeya solani]AYQ48056.1 hypothetical protein CTB91_02254 [Dickeya solani]AYQ52227.1 hypothetical protein DSOL99_02259 [Dickeya solani]ERO59039.1 Group-specific protein [Dickeya solani D s0432-1]MBD3605588.1 hypothetical protein [Dickeya solani]MBJ2334067.1 DUF3916 domain-containing protein [Dickeya solani]
MSMRRLALSNKKLRGIPRRLRALKKWSESYISQFPSISDDDFSYGYWNVKIPVHTALVQGKQTNYETQALCAQSLIDAAYNIYKAKPDSKKNIRVTCCIVLPDMFSSELCLFTDEEYFNVHTQPGNNHFGQISLLNERSLIDEWNLHLPNGFSELGVLRKSENDEGEFYHSEHWYIGEVNRS